MVQVGGYIKLIWKKTNHLRNTITHFGQVEISISHRIICLGQLPCY